MLRIRLRRIGKKHQPYYRVVVAEHTAPIQGKFVAKLGHFNPRSKELVMDADAIKHWLDHGAQPSNRVARLLLKNGMKHKLIQVHTFPERPGKKEQKQTEGASVPQPDNTTQDAPAKNEPQAEAPVEESDQPKQTPSDKQDAAESQEGEADKQEKKE